MNTPRKPAGLVATFDIKNSRDMLDKLHWEHKQLSEAKLTRAGKVYLAINCAWTAWHLHEWVWKGIKHRRDLRAEFAKAAGVAYQGFSVKQFGEWLVATQPDLDICQAIATSAKHIGFETAIDFETAVSGAPTVGPKVDDWPDWDSMLDVDSGVYIAWTLKIISGEKREPAVDLFERVVGFWTPLIYQNGIDS